MCCGSLKVHATHLSQSPPTAAVAPPAAHPPAGGRGCEDLYLSGGMSGPAALSMFPFAALKFRNVSWSCTRSSSALAACTTTQPPSQIL